MQGEGFKLLYEFLENGFTQLFFRVFLLFCFDAGLPQLLFLGAGSYAIEHMAAALLKMFLYMTGWPSFMQGDFFWLFLTGYVLYAAAAAFLFLFLIRRNPALDCPGNLHIAVSAAAIAASDACLRICSGRWIQHPAVWPYPGAVLHGSVYQAYSFLCCAAVLVMEWLFLRDAGLHKERDALEQMLKAVNMRQKSAQEAAQMVYIKCHDLKHQIRALAEMGDAAACGAYLREVQQAVSVYDCVYHTGCAALDYVLWEKALIFYKHQVEFSCMAQGRAVSFIAAPDLYALMGNALDNAFEQVLKEQKEERVISLTVRYCSGMVLLHLENRCSSRPLFRDGLPVTGKKDKNQHGFGVQSIRHIAKKYDGELFMGAECGKFYMDILFPQQEVRA